MINLHGVFLDSAHKHQPSVMASGLGRSPFVGIHVADESFWLVLGYCSFFPGHLQRRVNTAAQCLTTSHPPSPAWPGCLSLLDQLAPTHPHALPCRCHFTLRSFMRKQLPSVSSLSSFEYLVVVVQEAQSRRAVLVSVDAHHGLGGRRQGILQERLPGFILRGEGAALAPVTGLVLENEDRPLAAGGRRAGSCVGWWGGLSLRHEGLASAYRLWDNASVAFTKPTPTITATFQDRQTGHKSGR